MLTNIEVVKKDGRIQPFDITKLLDAVKAAASDIDYELSEQELKRIETEVYKKMGDKHIFLPQDMHWMAMTAANTVAPAVGVAYSKWHRERQALKPDDLSNLKVISKTGKVTPFNPDKIINACQKSATSIGRRLSPEQESQILVEVCHWLDTPQYRDTIATSDLHRFVMGALRVVDGPIYRAYHDYWKNQSEQATAFKELYDEAESLKYGEYNENANKDSQVISTKAALINEMSMKKLMRTVLNKEWLKAHDDGYIYIHDLGDLYKDTFNCNLFDLENLMKNKEHDDGYYAFKINNKITHEPKHVSSAFDILSSVTIAASGNQFGGFTVNHIDSTLAPYAEKSYQHYLADAKEYGITDAERYAQDKTLKEIKQGVQSYTYELAQTQNALGQTP